MLDTQGRLIRVPSRRAALGLALGTALAACAPRGTAGILRVADQRGGLRSLLIAAGEIGTPYSITWSQFPNAAPLIEALNANAVDTGVTGDAPFSFALASAPPIKAIGAFRSPPGVNSILVLRASQLRTVRDLVGKRIATPHGSNGQFLTLTALKSAGLPLDSVRFAFMSPSDGKAALTSGAVDGWAIWEPYTSLGVLEDGLSILDLSGVVVPGLSLLLATDSAIAAKRAALSDLILRLGRARAWARSNPAAYADVFAHETGMPEPVVERFISRSLTHGVPLDGHVIAEEQSIADLFFAAGVTGRRVAVTSAFDTSFSRSG